MYVLYIVLFIAYYDNRLYIRDENRLSIIYSAGVNITYRYIFSSDNLQADAQVEWDSTTKV